VVGAAIANGEESHGKYTSEPRVQDEKSFMKSEGARRFRQPWTKTEKAEALGAVAELKVAK